MADLSYLFGSKTPASVSGAITDTSSYLPAWLQEYTRALASQATAVAGQDYTPYTAPTNAATYGQDANRIAGFTPAQLQAQQQVLANQGNYQPYLNTASQTVPQAIGDYMNPYTDSVVNQIATLGQRNLTENLLPQVNSTFTGAGQFGSTRNADFTNKAVRDANESILNQQATALQSGYQNAANTALSDLTRQANLGQLTQQLGYQDTSYLDTMGQQQQALQQQNMDLANTDFTNQLNYPKTQLSFLSDVIRGNPTSTTNYAATSTPGVATSTISPLAAAAQGFLGARTITTTPTTTSSSDMRLKSNVQKIGDHPIGVGLYAYTIDGREEIGVMAQELLRVKPEAVGMDNDGFYVVHYQMLQ